MPNAKHIFGIHAVQFNLGVREVPDEHLRKMQIDYFGNFECWNKIRMHYVHVLYRNKVWLGQRQPERPIYFLWTSIKQRFIEFGNAFMTLTSITPCSRNSIHDSTWLPTFVCRAHKELWSTRYRVGGYRTSHKSLTRSFAVWVYISCSIDVC